VAVVDALGASRAFDETRLTTDLSGNLKQLARPCALAYTNFVVRQTGGRENRDLLSTGDRVPADPVSLPT
jgi:hypothetical protein